jgi:hypothetical protein
MRVRRMLAGRKSWVAAGLLALALVVAGAVVAAVDTVTTDDSADEVATASRDAVAPVKGGSSAGATVAEDLPAGRAQIAPSPPSPLPPDQGANTVVPGAPRVVRTAELRVEVAKGGFAGAFDRVASIATAAGGFLSSSSSASNDGVRSGELTVRVPADRFESVRQSLSGLGEVEGQAIRGEDVSGQLVDYEARLKSLQAQEAALLTLVGQAKEVGDVLRVQSTLFSVRQQIEQLQAQRANLEQQVSLATIQVSLFEPGAVSFKPVDDESPSLSRSFERAVDGTVAVVGGMIVVVGYLVPIAVLGLLVWGASRIFRRRPPVAPEAPAV